MTNRSEPDPETVPGRDRPRYLPLPGARLVRTGPPGGRVSFVAAPRTPVHAIADGVVSGEILLSGAAGAPSRVALTVLGTDGLVYRHEGLDRASLNVADGEPVEAGGILGAIPDGEPCGASLTVTVEGGTNELPDAYELLVGLPDPDELGYQARRPRAQAPLTPQPSSRASDDSLAALLAPSVGRQHPGDGSR